MQSFSGGYVTRLDPAIDLYMRGIDPLASKMFGWRWLFPRPEWNFHSELYRFLSIFEGHLNLKPSDY